MKDENGEDHDHPFMTTLQRAEDAALRGDIIYQKFTCSHCGLRQSFDEENAFYTHGTCERCACITDILSQGCGLMLITSSIDRKPKNITVYDCRNDPEVQRATTKDV